MQATAQGGSSSFVQLRLGFQVVTPTRQRFRVEGTYAERVLLRDDDGQIVIEQKIVGANYVVLRERMQDSKLMNSKMFTGHLEDVYLQMWQKYCEKMMSVQ